MIINWKREKEMKIRSEKMKHLDQSKIKPEVKSKRKEDEDRKNARSREKYQIRACPFRGKESHCTHAVDCQRGFPRCRVNPPYLPRPPEPSLYLYSADPSFTNGFESSLLSFKLFSSFLNIHDHQRIQ